MPPKKLTIEFSLTTVMQLLAIAGLIVSGTFAVASINFRMSNLEKDVRRISTQNGKLEKDVQLFAQILIEEKKNQGSGACNNE